MAKNYMADVAKLLGIELEEEFMVTEDDNVYKLTEGGLKYKAEDGNWYYETAAFLNLLEGLVEIIKQPWRPKKGEVYCRPMDGFEDVDFDNWSNHPIDFALKEAGMIFKTKAECEAALPALRKKYLGGDAK